MIELDRLGKFGCNSQWGIFVLAMEVITLKVQLFVEIQVGECSKSS